MSFEERHHDAISRLKVFFILLCMAAIIATYFSTQARFHEIESPCQHYGTQSRECQESFEAAIASVTHVESCAVQRKAGTLKLIPTLTAEFHITYVDPCRGVRLPIEAAEPDTP